MRDSKADLATCSTTALVTPLAHTITALDMKPARDTFNPHASFLQGKVTPLQKEVVETLHARFKQRLDALVEAALPGCSDRNLRESAYDYCHAASMTRQKISAPQLAEKAAAGFSALDGETYTLMSDLNMLSKHLKDELSARRRRPAALASRAAKSFGITSAISVTKKMFSFRKAANSAQPLPWDENDRIYFKLEDASASPVYPLIEKHLQERGFTITDYAAGRASDARKNEWRIGKILKDAPGLLAAYTDDPARASKKLMVVLTRNYEDIARGSYGRGWQSCRANVNTAVNYAIDEANCGVMAAYLVSEDDPDIHNPISRINVKPYDKIVKSKDWEHKVDTSDTMYATFNPIGLHHPGFVDAVNRFVADQFNQDKTGKYRLRLQCESYHEFKTRTLLPRDGAAALKALGVAYTKDKNGVLHVAGDINMRGLGLSCLPDLRNVVCAGSIDVSDNKLLTLEGLPRAAFKNLDASKNLLICFAGAPQEITGTFTYYDVAWLMTTHAAPKAAEYGYGNDNGYSKSNHLRGVECIGPIENPARFPGFKRDKK